MPSPVEVVLLRESSRRAQLIAAAVLLTGHVMTARSR